MSDTDLDLPLDDAAIRIDLEGFEGPLHLLLELSRAQKVDLARLSMTALADQFLAFVSDAEGERLELAADFLVMASWLAWLKSRLLLPKTERPKEEPDAESEAARLRIRLEKLAAAKRAAEALQGLPQLNRDVFLNGAPQAVAVEEQVRFTATLTDLLQAYCQRRARTLLSRHRVGGRTVFPIAEARRRLVEMAPGLDAWTRLERLAPQSTSADISPVSSTFGAALELIRDGHLEARQDKTFAPLFLRGRRKGGVG